MLVKDAIQVVIVRSEIALELQAEPRVGMIDPAGVVVALPELNRAYIRRQEYGTSCVTDSTREKWLKWSK